MLLRWTCVADALRVAASVRGVDIDPVRAADWWVSLHRRPVSGEDLCMGPGRSADRYVDAVRRHYADADLLAVGLSSWLYERVIGTGLPAGP